LRGVDRVLARHRVDDEEDVVGLHELTLLELAHQRVVDVQTAGGVEDEDVDALAARGFEARWQTRPRRRRPCRTPRPCRARSRSGRAPPGMSPSATCSATVCNCSTAAGRCRSAAASMTLRPRFLRYARELAAGGGLARALQAAHHDDGGAWGIEQRAADLSHRVGHVLFGDVGLPGEFAVEALER
jgi:hypothetical protein